METPTPPRPSLRWAGLLAAALVAVVAAPASAATNTEATQQAINFLSADVRDWTVSQGGCAACHRVGAALYGVASAKGNGYDMAAVTYNGQTNQANLDVIASLTAADQNVDGSWAHGGFGGAWPNTKTSYAVFGLAGYDAFVNTQYSNNLVNAARWALGTQDAAGFWLEEFRTLPTQWGNGPVTARMMVALAQAKQRVDPASAAQFQASMDKAADYLLANLYNPSTDADGMGYTQQMSWAIVGLKAAGPGANGQNSDAIDTLADRILARTSLNEGWGDVEGAASNEFDTGLAIYALCLAGRELDLGGRMHGAIEWLKARQNVDGSFGPMGSIRDIPTTFASLGLSCFGDYSVQVSAQPERQVVEFSWPQAQTVQYVVTVKNHGYQPDTYSLSAVGGLPGWTSRLAISSLSLAPGEERTLTLSVTVPPNQLPALSSEVSIIATSQANPGVKSTTRVLTYTNPPPPVTGWDTVTTIVSPPLGSTVTVGQSVNLSARIVALDPNGPQVPVLGPNHGVVTFFVAGVAIGADNDADGDGIYTVAWNPTRANWSAEGEQDYRAVYSGVTLQPASPNFKGSVAAGTLFIDNPAPVELDTTIAITSPAAGGTVLIGGNPSTLSAQVTVHNDNGTTSVLAGPGKGVVTFYMAGVAIGTDEDADGNGIYSMAWGPARADWSALGEQPLRAVYSGVLLQPASPNLKGSETSQNVLIRIAPDVAISCINSNPYQKSTTVKTCGYATAKEKTTTIVSRAFILNGVERVFVTPTASNASSGYVEHTFTTLRQGANVIEFTATDSFGSTTTRQTIVYVDNVAPVLTILSPTSGQAFQPGTTISVTTQVQDLSPVNVSTNFSPQKTVAAGGGTVTQTVIYNNPGGPTIKVVARDWAGNESSATVQVRISNNAPLAPAALVGAREMTVQTKAPACLSR
jgi:hypothetical protein